MHNYIAILSHHDIPGLLSNDGAYILVDGRNEEGTFVTLEISEDMLVDSIEYTRGEYLTLRDDPESIWYIDVEDV